MNETIPPAQRAQIRARFLRTGRSPAEIREAILNAAMRAPTAGNMMLYSILDITDQAVKGTSWPSPATTSRSSPRPKLVLIFCADYHRLVPEIQARRLATRATCRPPQLSDLILATNDAVIAAHAACTAAESFGVGSCYIGDIIENFETHRALLGLPPQTAPPVCMLVFGYPTAQQRERPADPRAFRSAASFSKHDTAS